MHQYRNGQLGRVENELRTLRHGQQLQLKELCTTVQSPTLVKETQSMGFSLLTPKQFSCRGFINKVPTRECHQGTKRANIAALSLNL